MMKTIDSLRSDYDRLDDAYQSLCESHGDRGRKIRQQEERIAQLEAALVEERAVYTYGDGRLAFYREVEQTRNIYYDDARRQLEESGVLLNVDKLQNGSN